MNTRAAGRQSCSKKGIWRLPKSIQADVDMLEMLAEEGKRDALFDQYVELLESNIKGPVIDRKMTYEKGKALLARYGIHLA